MATSITPTEIASVVRRYLDGDSAQDIGRDYGVTGPAISHHLRKQGIRARRTHKPGQKRQRKMTLAQREDALQRINAGESRSSIARCMGVSPSAFSHHLKSTDWTFGTSRKNTINEGVFDHTTPDSAYWVGFFMADGNVCGDRIAVGLSSVDIGHLEKLKDFLGSNAKITVYRNSGHGVLAAHLAIHSKRLSRALIGLGVTERKTFTASAQPDLRLNRDFWRGMIDGDGHIGDYRGSGRKTYALVSLCGTEAVVTQFRDWCLTIAPNIRAVVHQFHNIFTFSVRGTGAICVLRALYDDATTALDRKVSKARALIHRHDSAAPTVFRSRSQFRPAH